MDDIENKTKHIPRRASPDGAVLVVVGGRARGTTCAIPGEIGAVVTIGKAEDNDLVVVDEGVSRKHVEIVRLQHGLRVRDLGSTNGTRIGGAEIHEALIDTGAVLKLGEAEVLVAVAADRMSLPVSASDRFELARGRSEAMRRVFGVLERVAATSASVLLMGETGTGKDVLARSIHARSPRSQGAFEVLDCGAIAPTLVESELFGHERGAFTGAVSSRAGAFERAAGGTLFLDEVGELPVELQPKLLRVLESRTFRRVGGGKTLNADVRLVAATSRDLSTEVAAGRFREDLYYRLAVVALNVPPLRERLDDIPVLVETILAAADASSFRVSPATLAALTTWSWPGNVRELRNVVERAIFLAQAEGRSELTLLDFPPEANAEADDDPTKMPTFDPTLSYREARARVEGKFERTYVKWLLARHGGNVSAAAREARMDRNHLSDLMRKHGVRARG